MGLSGMRTNESCSFDRGAIMNRLKYIAVDAFPFVTSAAVGQTAGTVLDRSAISPTNEFMLG
jgi:hypothetical protein